MHFLCGLTAEFDCPELIQLSHMHEQGSFQHERQGQHVNLTWKHYKSTVAHGRWSAQYAANNTQ